MKFSFVQVLPHSADQRMLRASQAGWQRFVEELIGWLKSKKNQAE